VTGHRLSRIATAAAVLLVLAAYAFFGSGGTFSFRRVAWDHAFPGFTEGYYARLAESFLHGRLDLRFDPDPRWQQVTNVYDYESRKAQGMEWAYWDASYYGGKFYLYFSPVPVVLFYLPFRLVARGYPPDSLIATLACAWAFLAGVAFVKRALARRATHVPFALWVLLLGVANVIPFMLADLRTYEVAIATGMAMTAMWACALLRFVESGAPRHAMWMGLWLALAIATRPNLLPLAIVTAVALWRLGPHRQTRAILFALVPLVAIGAVMAGYNFLRFGSVTELGVTYQISYVPVWRRRICSLCNFPEAMRFVNNVVHYVFWAPHFDSAFPFVELQRSSLDPGVSFTGGSEQIGGVGALSPLTLLGTACALVLAAYRERRDDGARAAIAVLAGGWLVLCGLSTCHWVTARYVLDFMLLMTVASVVCVERALSLLAEANVRTRVLARAIALVAVASIGTCLLLGFRGSDGAFAKKHPALFEKTRTMFD
jgi:hypothetical protein